MPFRTILFDFDYTLADSSRGVIDCIDFALRELGLAPVTPDRACQTIGLSLTDTLIALAGPAHAGLGNEFARLFVERSDQVMADKTTLFPYVPGTVAALAERGMILGIVSTKFRRRIETVLRREGLRGSFKVIVGGEDVFRHKPDPESLALAMGKVSGCPQDTLYVGDSVTDAETAQRASVPFVAVLSGVTPREAFGMYAPYGIIADLTRLSGLIGR